MYAFVSYTSVVCSHADEPSDVPTTSPTEIPTAAPTENPTLLPTQLPTINFTKSLEVYEAVIAGKLKATKKAAKAAECAADETFFWCVCLCAC